jgi:hypothetical protein
VSSRPGLAIGLFFNSSFRYTVGDNHKVRPFTQTVPVITIGGFSYTFPAPSLWILQIEAR